MAGSDSTKMAIVNSTDFSDAIQEPYHSPKEWDLCSKLGGVTILSECPVGTYTVYVKFFNANGQPSSVVSDTIRYSPTSKEIVQLAGASLFTRDLIVGSRGNDVRELQKFLNKNGFSVAVSGLGSPDNETEYFGDATKQALIKFQDAYREKILVPAGLNRGTGYFGRITRTFVDEMNKGATTGVSGAVPSSLEVPVAQGSVFSRTLQRGMVDNDVKKLQEILAKDPEVYPEGTVSGYFGPLTERAVGRFQEKHGIAKKGEPGYGTAGPRTRAKLTEVAGGGN
jgi:peptidoglycan hydrolase-like protein with peptidoglycan-binding domain